MLGLQSWIETLQDAFNRGGAIFTLQNQKTMLVKICLKDDESNGRLLSKLDELLSTCRRTLIDISSSLRRHFVEMSPRCHRHVAATYDEHRRKIVDIPTTFVRHARQSVGDILPKFEGNAVVTS